MFIWNKPASNAIETGSLLLPTHSSRICLKYPPIIAVKTTTASHAWSDTPSLCLMLPLYVPTTCKIFCTPSHITLGSSEWYNIRDGRYRIRNQIKKWEKDWLIHTLHPCPLLEMSRIIFNIWQHSSLSNQNKKVCCLPRMSLFGKKKLIAEETRAGNLNQYISGAHCCCSKHTKGLSKRQNLSIQTRI